MSTPSIDITRYPDRSGHYGISITTIDVSPEIAAEWLGVNLSNRPKKENRIPQYIRDMREGRWLLDGSPIRFSKDGILLDGQNRLFSIIESGVTVPSVVIGGIQKEAQKVMDTGVARTLSDHLKMSGEPNSIPAAAVTGVIERWNRGIRKTAASGAGSSSGTLSEMNATYWPNRDIIQLAVKRSRSVRQKHGSIFTPAVLAGAFIILSQVSDEDAEGFFDLMCTDLSDLPGSDHPVAALISQMQKERDKESKRGSDWKLGMIIKAWNAWREGYGVQLLRFNPGGVRRENFPEPM